MAETNKEFIELAKAAKPIDISPSSQAWLTDKLNEVLTYLEQADKDNERLKDMLIEERLPNFCTGADCGCAERVGKARKKARIKLRQELEQALKPK